MISSSPSPGSHFGPNMPKSHRKLGLVLILLGLALIVLQIVGLFLRSVDGDWVVCGLWSGAVALTAGTLARTDSCWLRATVIVSIALSAMSMVIQAVNLNMAIYIRSVNDSLESGTLAQLFVVNYIVSMALSWFVVITGSVLLSSVQRCRQLKQNCRPSPYCILGGVIISVGAQAATLQVLAFYATVSPLLQMAFTGVWTAPVVIATGIMAIENAARLKGMAIASIVCSILVFCHQVGAIGFAYHWAVHSGNWASFRQWIDPTAVAELLLSLVTVALSSRVLCRLRRSKRVADLPKVLLFQSLRVHPVLASQPPSIYPFHCPAENALLIDTC